MKKIQKILIHFDKLAKLKDYDKETYGRLVNHCIILGILIGVFGTLWIWALIKITN